MCTAPETMDRENKAISQDIMELRSLTPFFEWCQARFHLDALIIVEVNIFINELSCLIKSFKLMPVNTFRFED